MAAAAQDEVAEDLQKTENETDNCENSLQKLENLTIHVTEGPTELCQTGDKGVSNNGNECSNERCNDATAVVENFEENIVNTDEANECYNDAIAVVVNFEEIIVNTGEANECYNDATAVVENFEENIVNTGEANECFYNATAVVENFEENIVNTGEANECFNNATAVVENFEENIVNKAEANECFNAATAVVENFEENTVNTGKANECFNDAIAVVENFEENIVNKAEANKCFNDATAVVENFEENTVNKTEENECFNDAIAVVENFEENIVNMGEANECFNGAVAVVENFEENIVSMGEENGEEVSENIEEVHVVENHNERLNGDTDNHQDQNDEGGNARLVEEMDDNENQNNSREDEETHEHRQNDTIREQNVESNSDEEQETSMITDNRVEMKSEKDTWTVDDISALLIKAINFHAPRKDLRTVIGCGADVNRPMKNGLCPLHYAAYSDYAECVELLLNSGANVNATDDIGYTPLHLAARRGNSRSLEILIENGAIINYSEPGTEIHQTDEKNKLGYTTLEPLNLAIQNGYPVCAKLLLEKGARPDNKYFMGFEICLAPLDDPDCLELLLQYGADPNVFNRCGLSPLMKACKNHHIEAVRKLIKYGADVNAICPPLFEQKSVVQFAINSGNIVIINILLGKGVTLGRQGEYRYSALHSGVIKGKAEVCRLLLQHGADANERTDDGATPMMLACSIPELMERREIVQLLLDCGADINAHSPSFSYFDPYLAPLTEYFKCIGSVEGFSIVRLLIRNGAKVNFSASGLDLEQKRFRDPFSVVPYVACMENNQPIFDLVISAASKYSPLIIHATDNIPEFMKDSLLYTATRPRELKHMVRVALRDLLTPGLPSKVHELPLPPLLQSYLLFK